MPNAVWLRFYKMPFAKVYPAYIAKAERKGRTKAEIDEIIRWLTGYSQSQLEAEIAAGTDVETFYTKAPALNPARSLITGTICGDRVQDIEEPLRRECRYLDKLIDELAKGKAMEKILRAG
ncbi:DUF2200 domain-containing protein [Sphingomonas alba]|uniref:DUF2200 domain-containing protein n=1 Tax=Sphingomonas alba TaxID=2908208 RepID=A0ABT0RP06_9SPHN|nr:DUF2200 domain-containing protein [Sphingomonas alba]MCL6684029.1 DUF2200 domain-containing protein [Sphingomonas alba]